MKVMVNFQLGKLNVKDEIITNDTSVGQRNECYIMLQKRNENDLFTQLLVIVFPMNRVSFFGLGPSKRV